MRRIAATLLAAAVPFGAGCADLENDLSEFVQGFVDVNSIQYLLSSLFTWQVLTA